MSNLVVRPLVLADIPRLAEIDAEFESDRFLDIDKTVDGLNATWRLVERPLDPPFKSDDFGLDRQQREEVAVRLREADGLYLVGEDRAAGKLAALLDVERERWRDTAVIWNLLIDRAYRRRGLGRDLMERAIAWAREQGLRGIVLESQTNNMPACRFYQAMGFKVCGLDDHFYSNDDIGAKEVAIFWWHELDAAWPAWGKGDPRPGG